MLTGSLHDMPSHGPHKLRDLYLRLIQERQTGMIFRIELESYLGLGMDDSYPAPCKSARKTRNSCVYPDDPARFDEPVYEVTINALEELTDLVAEVDHPIEIDGLTITAKDRFY